MPSLQRWRPLLVLALASACEGSAPIGEDGPASAPRAEAIINGTVDSGDPGVVALFAQQTGTQGGSLCTGEVISPHVVLTAAHCVSPQTVGTDVKFVVYTGNDFNSPQASKLLAVNEVHAHPGWSKANLLGGHDIAVVILKTPTTIVPLPYAKEPITEAQVGQAVRMVGYGITDAATKAGSGLKREAPSKVAGFDEVLVNIDDGRHDTCNGDSGGPTLLKLNGVETIIGVTSFGDASCTQGSFVTRVDAERTFFEPFVQQFDPPTAPIAEPPRPDGGTAPTGTGSTGPAAASGVGGGAAEGQSCQNDETCASRACGASPEGLPVCVDPTRVQGGCSTAGRGRADVAPIAALALLALGMRRRAARRYSPSR